MVSEIVCIFDFSHSKLWKDEIHIYCNEMTILQHSFHVHHNSNFFLITYHTFQEPQARRPVKEKEKHKHHHLCALYLMEMDTVQ